MAISPSFLRGDLEYEPEAIEELQAVAQYEGGQVLNDSLTYHKYLIRREDHLAHVGQPGVRHTAADHAQRVFGNQTIDNYASYPTHEYPLPIMHLLALANGHTIDEETNSTANSPLDVFEMTNGLISRDFPSLLQAHMTSTISSHGQTSMIGANGAFSPPNPIGPSSRASGRAVSMTSLNSPSPLGAISGGGIPFVIPGTSHPATYQQPMQWIIANLGTGPYASATAGSGRDASHTPLAATSTTAPRSKQCSSTAPTQKTPGHLYVPRNVASLARFGFRSPVKSQEEKKRKATPNLENTTDPIDTTQDEISYATPTGLSTAETPSKKRKTGRTTIKLKVRPKDEFHLEQVINGSAEARNDEEARQAANIRLQRLKAQDEADTQARSKPIRKARTKVDFLPEFFDKDSFPPKTADNQVRCVCGVVTVVMDDEEKMIACDKCNVWQHIACMGEAVPEDPENDPYSCQVCEPYMHRELIAVIRANQPLQS